MAGEFELIDWIKAHQQTTGNVVLPAGDDLAILRWKNDDLLLIGVDQVLEGVHFRSSEHSPQQIGAKVVNRNLSDCAAMACLPAALVTTVALPKGTSMEYAQQLYNGMRQAADQFDCPIVGGDTASWIGPLLLTVTILGRSAGIEPVTRKGARPGDTIFVTGPLGGSILGRHLNFTPRINEARNIASRVKISAMLDISDGLSRDLTHICRQSGVGAILDASAIPIHPDARTLSQQDHRDPLDHALNDGEDHELLFTAPTEAINALRGLATPIGTIDTDTTLRLRQVDGTLIPLAAHGWQHEF